MLKFDDKTLDRKKQAIRGCFIFQTLNKLTI